MSFESSYLENPSVTSVLFELLKPVVLRNIKIILAFLLVTPVGVFYIMKTYLGLSISFDSRQSSDLPDTAVVTQQVPSESSVLVDVSGAVANPGVYKFSSGSLVGDVLSEAGPILNDASIAWVSFNLNLARPLKNNEKIYIPFEHDITHENIEVSLNIELADIAVSAGVASESTQSVPSMDGSEVVNSINNNGSLVNLNNASIEDLKSLPGIGDVYANKIIDSRPYSSAAEFQQKAPISANAFTKIKELVTF